MAPSSGSETSPCSGELEWAQAVLQLSVSPGIRIIEYLQVIVCLPSSGVDSKSSTEPHQCLPSVRSKPCSPREARRRTLRTWLRPSSPPLSRSEGSREMGLRCRHPTRAILTRKNQSVGVIRVLSLQFPPLQMGSMSCKERMRL